MKLSQLTCRMDREEQIIVMDADLPIDRNVLHYGLVREIPRDAPWACAFVSHVCADSDVIIAEVKISSRDAEASSPTLYPKIFK